jgi:integrase
VKYDKARRNWRVRVTLPDGRQVGTRCATEQEGIAKRNELLGKAASGHAVARGTETVAQMLEHWLDNVLPLSVKPATVRNYRDVAEAYVIPHIGRVKLSRLGPEHVERMMTALTKDRHAANTVRLARSVLRRALVVAERRGAVSRNAAALTDAPQGIVARTDDALSVEDTQTVLRTAGGDRLEALAVLVLFCGVRQGEALALRWRDLDLRAGTLTVSDSKTDAGRRTFPLPATVVASLREHKMATTHKRSDDLVFATKNGTAIDRRNALRWWHDLTERAEVGRRRFHASRHTAATLMLNAGVPLEVVSSILGHAGLSITADVYARVGGELQRHAANTMDQLLSTGAASPAE